MHGPREEHVSRNAQFVRIRAADSRLTDAIGDIQGRAVPPSSAATSTGLRTARGWLQPCGSSKLEILNLSSAFKATFQVAAVGLRSCRQEAALETAHLEKIRATSR
ncbi:hypothetical protein ACU4GR_01590 [Methylobacterium oryzae CBMB20]